MEAKELRIGNLFIDAKARICSVEKIEKLIEDCNILAINDCVTTHPLKPIILTKEWLGSFGFKKPNSIIVEFEKNGFELYFLTTDDFYQAEFGDFTVTLKYVHQLQNLYFALTGEELTLKSK